jgi:hypothetical protein
MLMCRVLLNFTRKVDCIIKVECIIKVMALEATDGVHTILFWKNSVFANVHIFFAEYAIKIPDWGCTGHAEFQY